jgi:hypothetical protein
MASPPAGIPARLSLTQVLLCGAVVVTMSMGIRHGFGLFLQPLAMDRGWSRETFAFAIAVQNLAWGLFGPLAGMVADRCGAFRMLVLPMAFDLREPALASDAGAPSGSTGSYDVVWWIVVALGVFAAVVKRPVRETPIMRPMPQAA